MILADKIIELRKREGWSQEQLAEKLGVSRQSVSKWESTQSIPDMNKILSMSELFGVSTDYLLKDDVVDTGSSNSKEENLNEYGEKLTAVSLEEANEYLACKRQAAPRIAFGVMLCILSPILLILLSTAGEFGKINLTEDQGAMIGLIILILMVAAAVFLFVTSGLKSKRFEYLEKEMLDTAYGVTGMVKDQKEKYENTHRTNMVMGIILCIISVIPLFTSVALFEEKDEYFIVYGLAMLLTLVAFGVFSIVRVSIVWGSFNVLLEEGDYSRTDKKANTSIGGIYWTVVTAGYLLASFITMRWDMTWIVWPVAGVLYGGILAIVKTIKK